MGATSSSDMGYQVAPKAAMLIAFLGIFCGEMLFVIADGALPLFDDVCCGDVASALYAHHLHGLFHKIWCDYV